MKTGVVIAAGGSSTRMNQKDKLMIMIENVPVIIRSIAAFLNLKEITQIVVVCPQEKIKQYKNLISGVFNDKVTVIGGGCSRRESVFNGIRQLDADTDYVLIHDGARPLIKETDIRKCINATKQYLACCLAVRSKDTIKVVDEDLKIENTLDRNKLYNIQTPQGFTYEIAYEMHLMAEKYKIEAVDDCILAEKSGHEVYVVEGSYDNIKITTDEDIKYVEFLLLHRQNT
ncbi:MAG: 2-C-methyl-D-erythritol 4-phosphate cytidylyltransferase [Clostridia bacterium]|nr:2-C-methyl-D-erythritol 4-phosphate cytidylyltransferase [Clostridia bacterium]